MVEQSVYFMLFLIGDLFWTLYSQPKVSSCDVLEVVQNYSIFKYSSLSYSMIERAGMGFRQQRLEK